MAILWEKRAGNRLYQVRSAGRTRRLYTDGVFHSQYRPQSAQTGGIWDLLWLPALLAPPASIRRVLLLGVGGGAVIHPLHRHIRPDAIVGIEYNPVHLQIARRFFGITPKRAKLIEADAVDWLTRYAGPPFDLIIDDLFGEDDGEPVRAVPANPRWCATLCRHLSEQGVLVMNFISSQELRNSAFLAYRRYQREFATRLRLSLSAYENVIGAFCRFPTTSRELRRQVKALPGFGDMPLDLRQLA